MTGSDDEEPQQAVAEAFEQFFDRLDAALESRGVDESLRPDYESPESVIEELGAEE